MRENGSVCVNVIRSLVMKIVIISPWTHGSQKYKGNNKNCLDSIYNVYVIIHDADPIILILINLQIFTDSNKSKYNVHFQV